MIPLLFPLWFLLSGLLFASLFRRLRFSWIHAGEEAFFSATAGLGAMSLSAIGLGLMGFATRLPRGLPCGVRDLARPQHRFRGESGLSSPRGNFPFPGLVAGAVGPSFGRCPHHRGDAALVARRRGPPRVDHVVPEGFGLWPEEGRMAVRNFLGGLAPLYADGLVSIYDLGRKTGEP